MEDYKTTLRRLAVRDDRYIASLLANERECRAVRAGSRRSRTRPRRRPDRDGCCAASYMNAVEALSMQA